MEWKNYEETVRDIYENLGKNYGVSIEGFGNSCKRVGTSKVEHQIDVLTSHTDGVHKYYTAIECKYWDQKVNKDPIMKLNEIISDCKFNKGVIVSKKGFTEDAIKYAEHTSVSLVELKEYNLWDGSDKRTKMFINLEISQAKLESINCVVDKGKLEDFNNDFPNDPYTNYYVQQNDGKIIQMKDLVIKFLNEKTLKEELFSFAKETIEFPAETYLKSNLDSYSFPLNRIILVGFKIMYTVLDFDYIENKIWLIMKNLFEGSNYVISNACEAGPLKMTSITLTLGEQINVNLRFITKNQLINEMPN